MRRRALVALLFAALALGAGLRLGDTALRHRSEKRSVALVSEMVASGDWLIPHLDGVPHLQKPPLFYWAGALATELVGTPGPLGVRLVSALAGLALAASVFAWAGRALGPDHALACTVALAAMAQFWISARLGTADMLLVAFTTAALFAFERGRVGALAALVALAFLTKATAALLDVFAPVAVWLAMQRRLRAALQPNVLAWAALSAAAGLWWYAAALALVPEAPARLREFFFVPLGAGHSDLASDHYHPVWWYLPRLLGASAPAVVLLPFVIRDGWRSRFWRDAPALRFAATSALALFVAWSIVPQKGRHYLLPILPFFALLAGDSALRLWRGARRA